ncbi:MAG: ATP-dependent DNA helicase [Lachnospiraceae bacterium]|nr:ATP-dependent DNA helicase [Lachnospiraceae bacterium]
MDEENKPCETKRYEIRLSVRELVEFVLRSGDIDSRQAAGGKKAAMQEGSRLHRKIQRRMGASYQAEVAMKYILEEENFRLQIEGRADGVIEETNGWAIDEIKCMYMDISRLEAPIPVHLAQAMCYAYFLCLDKELTSVGVQMTYCQIETEEIRRFREKKTAQELKTWFAGLIGEYKKWADYQYVHHLRRQESLKKLTFPYPYRRGQKELAVDVYRSIIRKRNLYIQAPTGIGKTLSTLFPSLKAMGEGYGEKLFYLTAKTITRQVAQEGLDILRKNGLFFSSVTITAKEKLCVLEKPECHPDACPYARGHFDRVNAAVFALIHQETAIDREKLIAYAKQYQVCPFEFCLDISLWVDGIICDYNYVFDPNVRLKRYFAEGKQGDYLFLIDEAHNLLSRAREMYSAVLVKEDVLLIRRLVKERSPKLARLLDACNKSLLEYKRHCETYVVLEEISHLALQVMGIFSELEVFMEEYTDFPDRDMVLEFYFQIRDFMTIFEQLDGGYRIYSQMTEDGRFQIRLFCINPSGPLRSCMDQGISTILFSATLLPMLYYKELLSGEPEGYAIYAESPFSRENRLLLVARDISSKYSRRNQREYQKAAEYVEKIVGGRKGNYMVFCPSYQYMGELVRALEVKNGGKISGTGGTEVSGGVGEDGKREGEEEGREEMKFRLLVQESRMDEEEREAFLREFLQEGQEEEISGREILTEKRAGKKKSLVALCVMGGIFGEGIDLKEESLIGVIVIGTGLPMVCAEQEILKTYFEEKQKPGFAYAFQYPGMNKVMQAAGRVIRTVKDEGVIALLDERFLWSDYLALFPREWADFKTVTLPTVERTVGVFWESREAIRQGEA